MRALVVALLALLPTIVDARPAPRLGSPSAIAIDVATGAELFARRADDVRPIASLTKLFAALALRAHHVDLDRATTIDYDDAKAGLGGAATVLLEGETFANSDLLYAMMLASDNRVPSALARSTGMSLAELLDAMTRAARELGLAHTRLDDTTGILGNASTAREMALAVRAAVTDRVLARYMTTRHATVISRSKRIVGEFTSTVRPLWSSPWKIRGGKTGHTDAAGYCMVIVVRLGERDVAMAFLGAPTRETSYDDFDALAGYLAP